MSLVRINFYLTFTNLLIFLPYSKYGQGMKHQHANWTFILVCSFYCCHHGIIVKNAKMIQLQYKISSNCIVYQLLHHAHNPPQIQAYLMELHPVWLLHWIWQTSFFKIDKIRITWFTYLQKMLDLFSINHIAEIGTYCLCFMIVHQEGQLVHLLWWRTVELLNEIIQMVQKVTHIEHTHSIKEYLNLNTYSESLSLLVWSSGYSCTPKMFEWY